MNRTDARVFYQQMAVYARKSRPAQRWLDLPTGEVAAAQVRVGTLLVDEHGALVRVAAIGRQPGLIVLYTAPTGDVAAPPTRRVRLRPSDVVRVPKASR